MSYGVSPYEKLKKGAHFRLFANEGIAKKGIFKQPV